MFEDKIKQLLKKFPHTLETSTLFGKIVNTLSVGVQYDLNNGISESDAQANVELLLNELDKLIQNLDSSKNTLFTAKQLEKSIDQVIELKTVNEISISSNEISEFHFNYRIGDLIILPTISNNFIIRDLMSRDIDKLHSTVEKVGNVIKITQGPRKLLGIFKNKTIIFVPKSYKGFITIRSQSGKVSLIGINSDCMMDVTSVSSGSLINNVKVNRLQIDLKSGNLVLNNCLSKNLHINTHSGNINVEKILSENESTNLSFTTTSGNITLNDLKVNRLMTESKSGNIHGNNIIANLIECSSSNGNIKLKELDSSLKLKTEVGSCKIFTSNKFDHDADITSKVGNIQLHIPKDLAIKFHAKNKLGPINLPLDAIIYANDDYNIMDGYLISEKAPHNINIKNEMGMINIETD